MTYFSVEIHERESGTLVRTLGAFTSENDAFRCYYDNEYKIAENEIIDVYELEDKKSYYIIKYDMLCDSAIDDANVYYDSVGTPNEKRDYGEWIGEAEMYANTDEVVGYYLLTYPHDYKPAWDENITGIELTAQDQEVDKILAEFWKSERSV